MMKPTTNKPATKSPPLLDLDGHEVLVCVCGGIAAYKVCELVSQLVQRGARTTVAMTRSAEKFVGPVTFEALTGRGVLNSLWKSGKTGDIQHIEETTTADLVIVAPATANIIGKIAGGIADDLVSTMVMSAASEVLIAPAMNNRMWENPAVKANVATLRDRGYAMVGPNEGWLACRSFGFGRMAEPNQILDAAIAMLQVKAE
jgi:phosphopantothenoylcysteine decarboxylase/phosphopantothenate--cysteine ligase